MFINNSIKLIIIDFFNKTGSFIESGKFRKVSESSLQIPYKRKTRFAWNLFVLDKNFDSADLNHHLRVEVAISIPASDFIYCDLVSPSLRGVFGFTSMIKRTCGSKIWLQRIDRSIFCYPLNFGYFLCRHPMLELAYVFVRYKHYTVLGWLRCWSASPEECDLWSHHVSHSARTKASSLSNLVLHLRPRNAFGKETCLGSEAWKLHSVKRCQKVGSVVFVW